MTRARAQVFAVEEHFKAHPESASSTDIEAIRLDVILRTNDEFDLHNAVCRKDDKWRKSPDLSVPAIVEILRRRHIFRLVDLCGSSADGPRAPLVSDDFLLLMAYVPATGLYVPIQNDIRAEIYDLEPNLPARAPEAVLAGIRAHAPIVHPTLDPNLIVANNGVYDRTKRELRPFSPDWVFLTKSWVDYHPLAPNPVIHNDKDGTDWDVESWMASLSDDPGVVNLLWQIIGACIRPGTPWDKTALLYSTRGGNGKGTFCELLRGICGYTSGLSIDGFSSPFGLEELITVSAVVADENDVGGYIEKMANFKAAVTGDVIQVNRKYKAPVSYRFQGFIVQCVNDILKVRDRTGSLARRLLYVPFDKCFVSQGTTERKYIKHDYLHRKEVLEYVLRRVLEMDYDELDVPQACLDVLHEHRLDNSPVLDFAEQILPRLKWDLVPFTFLYDLYKAWFKENYPSGVLVNSRRFLNELVDVLASDSALPFECSDKNRRYRVTRTNMAGPEPLIVEYGLQNWMDPTYKGGDPAKIACPVLGSVYRGITRRPQGPSLPPQDPDNGPNDNIPSAPMARNDVPAAAVPKPVADVPPMAAVQTMTSARIPCSTPETDFQGPGTDQGDILQASPGPIGTPPEPLPAFQGRPAPSPDIRLPDTKEPFPGPSGPDFGTTPPVPPAAPWPPVRAENERGLVPSC